MAVLSPHDQLWRYKLVNGGAITVTGDSPPVGANDSGLWFETDTATLWVNYNDGNSTQWVAASGPPGAPSTIPGPQGPTGATGPTGPAGNGTWTQMTQAAYNALVTKDPNILYVIIG